MIIDSMINICLVGSKEKPSLVSFGKTLPCELW